MNSTRKKYLFFVAIIIVLTNCVKTYNPPPLQAKNNYLVVDGFINTGVNEVTEITLSRTRNLSDSLTVSQPELNASIQIVSNDGNTYHLSEQGNGLYKSAVLNLDNSKTYQLKISTSNGKDYSSDFTSCKTAPSIDSLTWQQPGDAIVYLYTHDPANNTHYYKWEYEETWQYNSALTPFYVVKNGLIVQADTTNQIDSCWQHQPSSSSIIIGASTNLSEDVINRAKIATIPQNDARIFVRYSILVKQRAITQEAYKYWDIVEKNSQNRGSLFDLQPGQLEGNIHSESDLTEPVVGFINCSSQTVSRLFINHRELNDWDVILNSCVDEKTIFQNPVNFQIWDYPDPNYLPYYFITGGGLQIAFKGCLDCREHGGTTDRPSFW